MTKAKLTHDDQLAEFTDRILDGGSSAQDEATLASDSELRALEETVLRLREAIPNDDPDEETISRMWKQIEPQITWKEHKSIWQMLKDIFVPQNAWQSQHNRQKKNLVFSMTVILLLLVVISFTDVASPGLPGASGGQISTLVFVVLGILIFVALWLFRRR
ncbi:MAG: hypothetical protein Kow002_09240 [Anaerolineales bacterium]